ncbi:MAG TPA: SGNH hydrolase domain-containing protein, partial [Actinomycetota bacterium]|nr:SGNH hydrolase domain-containing protein [Actinomycetota bacterium]
MASAWPAAEAKGPPPCFGAAARDAANPCDNPALRFRATPSPEDAPLLPALDCRFIQYGRDPRVCEFATPRRKAKATVALLGDSHAPAWRAAVDVLARNRRWRALTLARSSCPFADAVTRHTSDIARDSCAAWRRAV